MKKILIITDNIHSEQINGVVTTFQNIEQHAIADGYTVEYIDPTHFKHCNAPGYSDVKLALPIGIGKKIKKSNPDHIHIATEGPIGLAANLWCWKNNYKFNTSYHSKWPEFIKKMYGIPEFLTYSYLRWFHNHSGIVLTTTDTIVNELKQHKFKSNIIAWTRGVDRSIFNSSQRDNSLNYKRPILLNVGRVSIEKGLEDYCSLQYKDCTKIVVGDGPIKNELEKKYPDVIWTGTKKGSELAYYYANADVFVFTSVTDTFGLVMIESIACGTPIVGYPVPGPLDIIDARVGFIDTDLSAAIDRALLLNRTEVLEASYRWSWEECWRIFKTNLIPIN